MGTKLSISMNSTVEGGWPFSYAYGSPHHARLGANLSPDPKGSGGSSVEWLDRVRPLYVLNKKERC